MMGLGSEALAFVRQFIVREQLPDSYVNTVTRFYAPLAQRIRLLVRQSDHVPVIGINGAQGTGKSTCTACVAGLLKQQGLRVLILSIDDLYYPKAVRRTLAEEVHPLLITRGVPGTHDMALFREITAAVRGEKSGAELSVPRFDKAADDRCALGTPLPSDGVDVILFEGWCMGAAPQPAEALAQPINELENTQDTDEKWRRFVNAQLAGDYAEAFALIDYLVMLKAPDFEMIYAWRGEQEEKLRRRLAAQGQSASGAMNEQELTFFISHYERLTRWMMQEMPERADEVFLISEEHEVYAQVQNRPLPIRYMISTDLDATLLDETYGWDAALPALKELATAEACVVLNSSKTVSEMQALAQSLSAKTGLCPAPLVAENGGVLAIPSEGGGYRVECLGRSRTEMLSAAHQLRKENGYAFAGFADMTPDEVVKLTGLSPEAALLAMDRQATEPFLWNDTEERLSILSEALVDAGIRVVRGGQFFHLMGPTDKADGMAAALNYCRTLDPTAFWCVIALGDSPNDRAMLNAADIAVVIEHPVHGRMEPPTALQCMTPSKYGPTAWNEAVLAILERDD
ncbi:MAG: HAD-IIB family hydrolase [Pontiellaceae bacterium]|nr:HAD-IIB family hydrolase [Pontiellaceae bacterium]